MNARALMKLHWMSVAGVFITTAGVFFAITAAVHPVGPDLKVAPFVPARGHYAKLAQLDSHPANPDLPIDAERWMTNPKSIERMNKSSRNS
jgi:hypothetical protein